jgi:hypothetical protein
MPGSDSWVSLISGELRERPEEDDGDARLISSSKALRRLRAQDVEAFDGAPKLVRGDSHVTLGRVEVFVPEQHLNRA